MSIWILWTKRRPRYILTSLTSPPLRVKLTFKQNHHHHPRSGELKLDMFTRDLTYHLSEKRVKVRKRQREKREGRKTVAHRCYQKRYEFPRDRFFYRFLRNCTIFLLDHHYVGQPFQILHLSDEPSIEQALDIFVDDRIPFRVNFILFYLTVWCRGSTYSLCMMNSGSIQGIFSWDEKAVRVRSEEVYQLSS